MLLVGTDFIDNNASFNTKLKRDGSKVFVEAFASAGVAANTPAAIQFMGSGYNATVLIASIYAYVGVPEGTQAVAAGSWGWFQIRGPVTDVQATAGETVGSVGHSVAWTGATLYGSTSANVGNGAIGQVGVLTQEAEDSTTISIYLTGVYATPI